MTVIAVMPAAGLMISLGKLIQMCGADISLIMIIGNTMENIGWAIIGNLHILFAAAIGGSWAKEKSWWCLCCYNCFHFNQSNNWFYFWCNYRYVKPI